MIYEILLLPIDQIKTAMNAMAADGWVLHSQSFIGMQKFDSGEEVALIMATMQRSPAEDVKPVTERKPIGLGRQSG